MADDNDGFGDNEKKPRVGMRKSGVEVVDEDGAVIR